MATPLSTPEKKNTLWYIGKNTSFNTITQKQNTHHLFDGVIFIQTHEQKDCQLPEITVSCIFMLIIQTQSCSLCNPVLSL